MCCSVTQSYPTLCNPWSVKGPCPSPSPRVCPSSCPLHQWCHPAISPSDAFFSFCPQSFPESRTFPMNWLFTSGDQNTGVSSSASVLPMSIQGWFPLRLTQFSSVAQSCLTLCDPVNHSTPGLPVHHQLSESTQTQDHQVGDAIQPSHPLSSPSPPALNLSQHQGLFQWVSSSHQVAKVLEFQL